MPTAIIDVFDSNGNTHRCRTLLDTCASANFVTDSFAKKLMLKKSNCSIAVSGMNDLQKTTSFCITIKIKSIYNNFTKTLEFFTIPKIIDSIPGEYIARENLGIHPNLNLADPEFHKPAHVDMLLGTGPTLSFLSVGQINLSRDGQDLFLNKTKLGWIIGGGFNTLNSLKQSNSFLSNIQFDLEKFWKIEECPNKSIFSLDEIKCEDHFNENITRESNGQYTVALPFKENPNILGDSKTTALRRMNSLIKRFHKNPILKQQYSAVIDEYIKLNHMTLVENSTNGYFMPHHAVVKESSNTTKLRVVFDASAKSSSGKSLHDILMVGPTIQDDLFSLLIRFRIHNYVIIADIEKMYRQFLVRKQDRQFQKVLWLNDGRIAEYELNTVTFGVTSSPFLAIRCLHKLAHDESKNFPLAAEVVKKDLYVDNVLTGVKTIADGQKLCSELTSIFESAQMNLRQWASNESKILENISEKNLDATYQLDKNEPLKTLGIFWQAHNDTFIYNSQKIKIDCKITKRQILSEIAKIFDPLGLLGPIILFAKKIMQNIWNSKIDWDESVPMHIQTIWFQYCEQFNHIDTIRFQRKFISEIAQEIEIHGFCDASQDGYGAVLYARSRCQNSNYFCQIICSKSRVAPLKTRSIPRLELCAAQLLTNLYTSVKDAIRGKMKITNVRFWSDSTITLHWINTQSNLLKTFVANRVADIQIKTNVCDWFHIRSEDNPADSLSRGQMAREFMKNTKWIHGPTWLSKSETFWPLTKIPIQSSLPEMRNIQCLITQPTDNVLNDMILKFSSFMKLKRILAWCLRFSIKQRERGILTLSELLHAETIIISFVQKKVFFKEINLLKQNGLIKENNKLCSLDPFLDRDGILRVGGRLRKALIPFSEKHPIILPRDDIVTTLIISECHINNFHTGIQNTLHSLRRKYWVIDGKNQVRRVIKKCVICFRARPQLSTYKMGNLPVSRITEAIPFERVGIDFCGPFYIKEKKYNNRVKIKAYAAIFVCMVIKAVHIEIVSDLSTEAFIAALERFISRRGYPSEIHSDNGSNFRGAANQLKELYVLFQSEDHQSRVITYANSKEIKWHFIPPYAPNFGGLWESTIKQFKHHFKRVFSNTLLTFEEFNTAAISIESILNSRPLIPDSSDPNDLSLSVLTPGHFLTGKSLRCIPQPNCTNISNNRVSTWKHLTKLKQEFWSRWHKEYLHSLIMLRKKRYNNDVIKKGTLVLILEDDLPCSQWLSGRVIETHPGTDNVIRAVTLKTSKGILKRIVSKIAVLPTSDNENL